MQLTHMYNVFDVLTNAFSCQNTHSSLALVSFIWAARRVPVEWFLIGVSERASASVCVLQTNRSRADFQINLNYNLVTIFRLS